MIRGALVRFGIWSSSSPIRSTYYTYDVCLVDTECRCMCRRTLSLFLAEGFVPVCSYVQSGVGWSIKRVSVEIL